MDWHKLQHTLYNLDPTDPRDDLARLQQSAQKPADDIPTIDYVNESVEVPKGSMPLNINSVNDFARLAGVEPRKQINEDDNEKKPTRGFAAGFQSVQKGGKWGPDAVSNRIGQALTPDKKKSKTQATSSNVKLVDRSRQKDFDEAVAIINRGETTDNPRHHQAVFQAFRNLMNNPNSAQKTLTRLKSTKQEQIEPQKETVTKKEYSSIKEELYKMLNAKK